MVKKVNSLTRKKGKKKKEGQRKKKTEHYQDEAFEFMLRSGERDF